MRITLLATLLMLAATMAGAAGEDWRLLDDFEGRPYQWSAESGPGPNVKVSGAKALSGKRALAVTLARQTPVMIRATWQVDVSGLAFTPDSRLRLHLFGSKWAQKPHGGLIAIESGGRKGGGDSHWMAPIPEEVYSREEWQEVVLPPFRELTQPEWSEDADGRLDVARVAKLLFVAQQESAPELSRPFTLYLDDVEVTHMSQRQPVITPASNESTSERIRPKIRGFVDRLRDPEAQVTFGDLAGWGVYRHGDVEATLVRSEEEPLFERYSAKLTYASGAGGGWIALRPREPVPLPKGANAAHLWIFGNNWDWVPDATTPRVEVSVTVRDASGEEHRFLCGRVNWKFWGLLHKRICDPPDRDSGHLAWGGDGNGRVDGPAFFTGIEVRNCGNSQPRVLYFDSVAFGVDRAPKVQYQVAPAPLPFPTTPDTILPSTLEPVSCDLARDGEAYVFTCRGAGEPLRYRYVPQTGTLSDLTCETGDVSFRPADGAGPEWEAAGETVLATDPRVRRKLLSAKVTEGTLTTRWRWSLGKASLEFELALRAKGRSLIHEWRSKSAQVTRLSLGRGTGLQAARVFPVPYYTVMGAGGAGILYDRGLYASHLIDWYATGCSYFCAGMDAGSGTEAGYAGGAGYNPKTDGKRNPLDERCILTVSPRFEEVLPNIANPPTPMTDVLRTHLYTHLGGITPNRFDVWLEQFRDYRRHGVDGLIVTQHEDSWTEGADVGQGPQEYTMTLDGPPDVGGDAKMLEYYRGIRELGYYVGPYNNYTDYSPLGKSWDPANATRLPNGEWQRAWPPTFSIRPLKAAEMAAYYAPAQVRKFGVNTTYCDVHTCVPPWGYVDYEAGQPGAGKMRTTFESYGRVLMTQREAYGGPAFSEGVHHCFYAGLIDGSYAQMGLPNPAGQPLLLDFDLRKMHPLSADISMLPGAYWNDNEYHCMAATIAYGHIGFFPVVGIPQACRYFYLMQPLQRRYVQVPVKEIGYWDGEAFLGVSEALPRDVHKRGQVRVRYENGLEVFVNYNARERWKVAGLDLGAYAWAARMGDDFLEYSTDVDGRRVSFVRSPELLFADAGGKLRDFGPIQTDGEVALKSEGATGKRLYVLAPTQRLRLAGAWTRAEAFDKEGKPLGDARLRAEQGSVTLDLVPGAIHYDLR